MKATVVLMMLVVCMASARGEDIVQVLQRSNELRLAGWAAAPAESARGHRLQEVFDMLAEPLRLDSKPELRVVTGNVVAETLLGHVVVVNEVMGDLPLPQLIFLLGHELGHVAGGHWPQLVALYQQLIPGEVTREHTDSVSAELGRTASMLSHRQELEADLHGLKCLQERGYTREDAVAFLMGRGLYFDTATHPGTRKRLGQLREADRTELGAVVPAGASSSGL